MDGMSMGTDRNVESMLLCLMFVLATHHERSPAIETDMTVAAPETSSECLRALENLSADITAKTFIPLMVESIFARGRMIAIIQKTPKRNFRDEDIVHFVLLTLLLICSAPVLRTG